MRADNTTSIGTSRLEVIVTEIKHRWRRRRRPLAKTRPNVNGGAKVGHVGGVKQGQWAAGCTTARRLTTWLARALAHGPLGPIWWGELRRQRRLRAVLLARR